MELLVLNTLGWRMQALTACSFIDYYLHKFNGGDVVSKSILDRSIDLILSTSKGVILVFMHFCTSRVECDGDQFLKLGNFVMQLLNSWFSDRQRLPQVQL
jgi:cyclin D1/2/4, plant